MPLSLGNACKRRVPIKTHKATVKVLSMDKEVVPGAALRVAAVPKEMAAGMRVAAVAVRAVNRLLARPKPAEPEKNRQRPELDN